MPTASRARTIVPAALATRVPDSLCPRSASSTIAARHPRCRLRVARWAPTCHHRIALAGDRALRACSSAVIASPVSRRLGIARAAARVLARSRRTPCPRTRMRHSGLNRDAVAPMRQPGTHAPRDPRGSVCAPFHGPRSSTHASGGAHDRVRSSPRPSRPPRRVARRRLGRRGRPRHLGGLLAWYPRHRPRALWRRDERGCRAGCRAG